MRRTTLQLVSDAGDDDAFQWIVRLVPVHVTLGHAAYASR
jgi:hypothetical protein